MSVLKSAIFLLLLIHFFSFPAYAKEEPFLGKSDLNKVGITKYESINPNLLVYPLKRVGENLKLFSFFDKEKKDQYLLELYDKRFLELAYIINFNKTGFIGFSVDRYNTFVGTLKERSTSLDRDKITKKIKVLEKLRDRYHSGSAPWEKIQQGVDTTKSLI